MVIEVVWLAPFKCIKHIGYGTTTKDMEISIQQLCKKNPKKPLFSQREILKI